MAMNVTRGYAGRERQPFPVVTIGNFDGHHLGHRALLDQVVQTARRMEGTAMVLTFDPHPVKILAPHVDLKFLTSPEEKLQRFEDAGIDEVVFLEFTPAFAALSPEAFAQEVLYRGLHVRQIFVGQHFAFGKGRTGTVATLSSLGRQFGFSVDPVNPVLAEGGVVSSTRVRKLIQEGQVAQAAAVGFNPTVGTHAGLVAHGHIQVAQVVDGMALLGQPVIQAGVAHGAGTHVDAAPLLAEIHGDAENANGLRVWVHHAAAFSSLCQTIKRKSIIRDHHNTPSGF